jgi:hypothetical protein
VKDIVLGKKAKVVVDEPLLEEYLGVPRYRYGMARRRIRSVSSPVWPGPRSAANC